MAKIAHKISELLGNDEETRKKKEQFAFLQKMAQAKCAEFKADLEKGALGDKNKIEIGGGRYFKYYMSQHVDLHSGANERISEAVDSFFRGKDGLKDGFKNLINGALETLINDTTIGETQEDMFFVFPENNAIVRMDVKAYKYSFSNKGLIADCENVFCYTMAKSIIDHTTLNLDELLYFISDMSGADGNIKVVDAFVDEITSVWAKLENKTARQVSREYQLSDAKAETKYKRGIISDVIKYGAKMTLSKFVQEARNLGWIVDIADDGSTILTKKNEDTVNEVYVDKSKTSIKNAIELINAVESRDKA